MALKIHYQNKKFRLKDSRHIREWLEKVIIEEGNSAGNISFIFTDDSFLREINRSFLEHDYFTDVITFDLSEQKGVLDGEIYISVDTVLLNAKEYMSRFSKEVKRVMVHGILHLSGYDDRTASEREVIRGKEDYYLGKLEE